MKSDKGHLTHTPFKKVKKELEGLSLPTVESSVPFIPLREEEREEDRDKDRLFRNAMSEVVPIDDGNRIYPGSAVRKVDGPGTLDEEAVCLEKLDNLVRYGEGFSVSDTPEFIEGTRRSVHSEVARRLHRGEFSIQAHIDLHGLTVREAEEAFHAFMSEAVSAGKRAVMVVHGRGRSSPVRPVLKGKVMEWLTRGPWRKWVIAFSSARACDGGTGATYVLLSRRPITKRYDKKWKQYP